MPATPANLPDDVEALKHLLAGRDREIRHLQARVEQLLKNLRAKAHLRVTELHWSTGLVIASKIKS